MTVDPKVRRFLRGDTSSVHRSRNPELRAALEALPEYAEALQHLTAAAALEPPAVRRADFTAAGRQLVDAVKAGATTPPAELIDELAQREAERRAAEQLGEAITAAQSLLVGELEGAVDAAKVCATLTSRVQEIVAQARGLKTLPTSAEEAIASDAVDDWRAVSGIAAAYAEVREAQAEMWSAYGVRGEKLDGTVLTRPSVTALAAVAWIRNPQDLVDIDDRPQVGEVGYTTHQLWPENFNAGDAVWWFREHPDAEPWCPTPTQYEKHRQQLQAELRASRSPEARKAERAADQNLARGLRQAQLSRRGY